MLAAKAITSPRSNPDGTLHKALNPKKAMVVSDGFGVAGVHNLRMLRVRLLLQQDARRGRSRAAPGDHFGTQG